MGTKKLRIKCPVCGKKRRLRGSFQTRTKSTVVKTCEECKSKS